MTLRVEFSVDKPVLLVGERPLFSLTLMNDSDQTIQINHPEGEGGCSYRVLVAQSGDETYLRANVSRGGAPFEMPLEAGQQLQADVTLPDEADLSMPGVYAISAIYGYNNDAELVESRAVRITVQHFAARHLALDSVQGDAVNGTFINTVADPPDVAIARFMIMPEGGLETVLPVGKCSLTSRPFPSLPDNKGWANGTWIGWLDDRKLSFVHIDEMNGPSKTGELQLSLSSARIVPPLYIMAGEDESQRELGGVVVWGDGDGNTSQIQVFGLQATDKTAKGNLLSQAAMPVPRPKWAASHALSSGTKILTFLHEQDNKLYLGRLPWPEMEGGSLELTSLVEWEAAFVAAGATMGLEDEIYGATMMWTGPEEYRALELVGWKIAPDGSFSENYRKTLPWSWRVRLGEVKVRVRSDGIPAALMRNGHDLLWSVWDGYGEQLIPVPEPYASSKKNMDIAFYKQTEVVLISAQTMGGFVVKQLDGSDLPIMPH